jgi:anti-anti-sigma factor
MLGALSALAQTPEIWLLVCDMTNVSFFSCAGLIVLLDVRAALVRRFAVLRVVAQSPAVVLLFDITGLAGMLGLRASLEEAMKDVGG